MDRKYAVLSGPGEKAPQTLVEHFGKDRGYGFATQLETGEAQVLDRDLVGAVVVVGPRTTPKKIGKVLGRDFPDGLDVVVHPTCGATLDVGLNLEPVCPTELGLEKSSGQFYRKRG
jgi:hypothetical protein